VAERAVPPMLAIVGKKHVGKTTLVTRLSAELTRRGLRIMTLKHGSHTFNIDPTTTDTYHHYHEGQAEKVAMVSPDKFALVERWAVELPPEEIAARYLADADLVLCEGFKKSAIAKVEIHRTSAHPEPLWSAEVEQAASWRAMVSDVAVGGFPGERFDLAHAEWLDALASWTIKEFVRT
jgi:molybdopterin-guanine dinucleotide biosynthesis protein MobB